MSSYPKHNQHAAKYLILYHSGQEQPQKIFESNVETLLNIYISTVDAQSSVAAGPFLDC